MIQSTEAPQPTDFVILVEWSDDSGIQKAGRGGEMLAEMQQQSEIAINRAMGIIHYMAHKVTKTMQSIEDKARPDEAEVDFGITLDAQAGALLSSAGVGAQLTVKLKWTIEQPQRTQVLVEE